MTQNPNDENPVTQTVRKKYGALAQDQLENSGSQSCCCGGGCGCGTDSGLVEGAQVLYAEEEISELPDSVTGISLGCGSPTAIADLKPGQTVLDLGSGGGIDCFLAARQVGETGQVIGLDMTPQMIDLARTNAKKLGTRNVEFRYGHIEEIPLPDASVDAIISNCVINLSDDKDAVFSETFRVLREGGTLNVSDIVTYGSLPPALSRQLSAWAGCISGALDEEIYIRKIRAAGFRSVEVLERRYYPPEMIAEDVGVRALLADNRLRVGDLTGRIASVTLRAVK